MTYTIKESKSSYIRYIGFALLFLMLGELSFGQQTFLDSITKTIDRTKEELIKLTGDFYVIQPDGISANRVVYIRPNGVLLIDPQ